MIMDLEALEQFKRRECMPHCKSCNAPYDNTKETDDGYCSDDCWIKANCIIPEEKEMLELEEVYE
jgi:hypothetical protein